MENLKLEVGKFYRTRNGEKVECILFRPDRVGTTGYNAIMLLENGNISLCAENGNFWNNGTVSYYDIISEWEENPEDICKRIGFDPTCLPAWANWIAMDEDGEWAHFDNEPELRTTIFYSETDYAGYIPDEYAPTNFTGHWTESKFKVK